MNKISEAVLRFKDVGRDFMEVKKQGRLNELTRTITMILNASKISKENLKLIVGHIIDGVDVESSVVNTSLTTRAGTNQVLTSESVDSYPKKDVGKIKKAEIRTSLPGKLELRQMPVRKMQKIQSAKNVSRNSILSIQFMSPKHEDFNKSQSKIYL